MDVAHVSVYFAQIVNDVVKTVAAMQVEKPSRLEEMWYKTSKSTWRV